MCTVFPRGSLSNSSLHHCTIGANGLSIRRFWVMVIFCYHFLRHFMYLSYKIYTANVDKEVKDVVFWGFFSNKNIEWHEENKNLIDLTNSSIISLYIIQTQTCKSHFSDACQISVTLHYKLYLLICLFVVNDCPGKCCRFS